MYVFMWIQKVTVAKKRQGNMYIIYLGSTWELAFGVEKSLGYTWLGSRALTVLKTLNWRR